MATAFIGCAQKAGTKPKRVADTRYTSERAMEVYDYQPERALEIVDSAVVAGSLSRQEGEYLRMKIYAWTQMDALMDSLLHGPQGVRFDSARVIGERLLADEAVGDSLKMQQDVLEVLVYAARHQADTVRWFRRSQELVDVCHQLGAETEALRTEAEVGAALYKAGRRQEGLAKLDSVIALLDDGEKGRFNELDATIIALKRKTAVLNDEGRYVETIPLASRILELLNDYEQHPDKYHDGTYREPQDSIGRADYINFYRTQAQSVITAAYAFLGKMDNIHEAFNEIERSVRNATAREHIARYHALEQEMLREKAEARRQRVTLVANMLVVGIFALLAFLCYAYFQNRKIRLKNRVLVRMIEEKDPPLPPPCEGGEIPLQERIASLPHREGRGGSLLFNEIDSAIRSERLYADPSIQRNDICDRFGLRREVLNQLLAVYANAPSFPVYINNLRLSETCRLLRDTPTSTINAIADEVGLSPRNLRRLFMERYGITPTEYRQGVQEG